mgnify:CR=1 FL=1
MLAHCAISACVWLFTLPLVLGEIKQVGLNLADEHSTIGFPSVLHHELNHVVAVAVLHQAGAALAQLLEDDSLLVVGAVLEDTLHDAAAVRVGGELLNTALESVDDELDAQSDVVGSFLGVLRSISGNARDD